MKHLCTIIAALFLGAASFSASAQLQIGTKHEASVRLATIQQAWNWLYDVGGRIYFVTKTDNQFDDDIWLDLGEGREEAARTVLSLTEALEQAEKGDSIEVESRGERYLLTCTVIFGSRAWYVSALDTRKVYAGKAPINDTALRKAYKTLTKR